MTLLLLNIEWKAFFASRVIFGFTIMRKFKAYPDITYGEWTSLQLTFKWNFPILNGEFRPWHRCWVWDFARELDD